MLIIARGQITSIQTAGMHHQYLLLSFTALEELAAIELMKMQLPAISSCSMQDDLNRAVPDAWHVAL